jgi:hypothetical protein
MALSKREYTQYKDKTQLSYSQWSQVLAYKDQHVSLLDRLAKAIQPLNLMRFLPK